MSNQPNTSEFIPDEFFSIANGTNPPGMGTIFQYDTSHVDYTLPVGKAVGLELYTVDYHPFHIHVNPFQLTTGGANAEVDWFQSGDWHDTLLTLPGDGHQRVLMQTDYFTGPTVVHCHILHHEDNGMMVQVNFTGVEGSRYPPAYGDPYIDHDNPTLLIDPRCYKSSKEVKPAIFTTFHGIGLRVGKECKSASPSPPSPPPTPPPLPTLPSLSPPPICSDPIRVCNCPRGVASVVPFTANCCSGQSGDPYDGGECSYGQWAECCVFPPPSPSPTPPPPPPSPPSPEPVVEGSLCDPALLNACGNPLNGL
eukprot:scaffold83334_cov72-Phaeocystis_antarctica.AAC.4